MESKKVKRRDTHAEFVRALVDCQRSLYSYIWKLLPDTDGAKDVLQKTNLLLLEKQHEFPEIENFGGWAARHAYYQVLAYRKTRQRDRHCFNDELVHILAQERHSDVTDQDEALRALGSCLKKLGPFDRSLVEQRYASNLPLGKIAQSLKRTPGSVANSLYRIRQVLMECIQRTLTAEGAR